MQTPVPAKMTPRNDFNADNFRKMLHAKGVGIRWEQAERCSCRTSGSQHPSTDCTICGGRGWEWRDPQDIVGLVFNLEDNLKLWEELGALVSGTIKVSLEWEHLPAFRDRLTLLDAAVLRQEVVKHVATVDELAWPVRPVTMDLVQNDKVQATTVSVRHCRIQDEDGLGGKIRAVGTDFVVNADGNIDWALGVGLGTAPDINDHYAISYWAVPRYIVANFPFAIRQSQAWSKKQGQAVWQALPVNVIAQLDFLHEREGG